MDNEEYYIKCFDSSSVGITNRSMIDFASNSHLCTALIIATNNEMLNWTLRTIWVIYDN